jgi:hypothetical protein
MTNTSPSSPRAAKRRLRGAKPDTTTTHKIIHVILERASKAGIKYLTNHPYKLTVEQWNTLVSRSQ